MEEQPMNEMVDVWKLTNKAWDVINSCETVKQARGAMKYLDLLSQKYPQVDVSGMRRELVTLFEFK